jgi:L-iditol 2-dehydrogenase
MRFEPLACVVHSLSLVPIAPETTLVVVGDGGFGILHALVARAMGVPDPLVFGHRRERLDVARAYGLSAVDERDGARAMLADRTGGRGADIAIETTGAATVWEEMPALVRRGGVVSLFGGLPGGTRVAFDAARLHYDEVRIVSPFHFTPRAVRRAYELLSSGAIDPLPLITHRSALGDLAAAFSSLDAGDGIKVAIVP